MSTTEQNVASETLGATASMTKKPRVPQQLTRSWAAVHFELPEGCRRKVEKDATFIEVPLTPREQLKIIGTNRDTMNQLEIIDGVFVQGTLHLVFDLASRRMESAIFELTAAEPKFEFVVTPVLVTPERPPLAGAVWQRVLCGHLLELVPIPPVAEEPELDLAA